MTPFESAIRDAVEDWITSITGCESEFLAMVKEGIMDGDGHLGVTENFVDKYVDYIALQIAIENAINIALDALLIEVNIGWESSNIPDKSNAK